MKKLLFLCLFLPFFSLNSFSQSEDIIGKWVGEDNNQIGYIVFDDEGYAAFEIEGQVLGGKNFEMNGEKGEMTYIIDESKDPIAVDLTMKKFKTGDQRTFKCIVKFINKDKLMFAMGLHDKRPVDFKGEESIELKRVE